MLQNIQAIILRPIVKSSRAGGCGGSLEEGNAVPSNRVSEGQGHLCGLPVLAGGCSVYAAGKGWAFARPCSTLASPSGPGMAAVGGSTGTVGVPSIW